MQCPGATEGNIHMTKSLKLNSPRKENSSLGCCSFPRRVRVFVSAGPRAAPDGNLKFVVLLK